MTYPLLVMPADQVKVATILIVDDHADNLTFLATYLKDAGYRTLVARDGLGALEKARYQAPDLILLDVTMPTMDGIETCRRLKADSNLQLIPVIFMTGRSAEDDKLNGFAVGGADYITKPFHAAEVLARVQVHLKLRDSQRRITLQNVQLQNEISERSQAEEALRLAHTILEQRVAERTAELAAANIRLRAEIAERVRAEHVQDALYRIAQAATVASTIDDLYQTIHHILSDHIAAENFCIASVDAHQQLHIEYFRDQQMPAPNPDQPGLHLADYVFRTRAPLLVDQVRINDLIAQGGVEWAGPPPSSWIGVPLQVDERMIGVMAAQSYVTEQPFLAPDLQLMALVATQVALAIERRQAITATERQLRELALLHAVSTAIGDTDHEAELLTNVLQNLRPSRPTDGLGVVLFDTAGGPPRRHPVCVGPPYLWPPSEAQAGLTLIERALRNGRSWLVADVHQDLASLQLGHPIRASLAVSLKVKGEVIGMLMLSSDHPNSITTQDQRFFETVASQLSTAIEKLRLHQETVRHLQQVKALYAIDQAITSHRGLRFTFETAIDQMVTQLGVTGAIIRTVNTPVQPLQCVAQRGGADLDRFGLGNAVVNQQTPLLLPDLHANDARAYIPCDLPDVRSYAGYPISSSGQVRGVIELMGDRPMILTQDWLDLLSAITAQLAVAIDHHTMFYALQQSHQTLCTAYDETLEGWARALELRDYETEGHSRRVTDLTLKLARAIRVPSHELTTLRYGALLHDIGKIGIPDRILFHQGPLSDEDWVIMRRHPIYAVEMLEPITHLQAALLIPKYHHERWDGRGYPYGLAGAAIPLAARMFTLVDIWDALTSDRPYRRAWSREQAITYIRAEAGTIFDPSLIEPFLTIIMDQELAAAA